MVVIIVLVWIIKCLNILREYERGVVFRLGRVLEKEKGPGLVLILWPIDKLIRVSLRVVTWDVPPQDIITRDNVSFKVNAVVYFRVVNATRAILEVEQYRYAVEQAAQTSLRSVLGEVELDDLLSQREKLNSRLQSHSRRTHRGLGRQGDAGAGQAGGPAAGNVTSNAGPPPCSSPGTVRTYC